MLKFNIFTQSVGCAVKAQGQGITGEKGMGCESPASTVGVCIECFYIRRRKSVIGKLRRQGIKMRIFSLYDVSHKTCFDVISYTGIVFLFVPDL